MQAEYWNQAWESKDIGFNQPSPNALLTKHANKAGWSQGNRLFVPLCGKTVDIHWLRDRGFKIVGAELNEQAVIELFQELDIQPEITKVGSLQLFSAADIEIYQGDIFELTKDQIGEVHGTYDRAAMIALPDEIRRNYTTHLRQITDSAPILLITFQYEQAKMDGPPFSIDETEVKKHYHDHYTLDLLEMKQFEGLLKGQVEATESIHFLH